MVIFFNLSKNQCPTYGVLAVTQPSDVLNNVECIVVGFRVEVASNQTDFARRAGQFDELGSVEGLHHSVRQVLVIFPVIFGVQLQPKTTVLNYVSF